MVKKYYLGLTTLDLTGARPFIFGEKLLPLCDAFLIWAPFNLSEPAPDRLVCAVLLAMMPALANLFLRILAPLLGFSFMKQVLGLATILPFLGPDVHLKPLETVPFLARLRIWLTPSVMAEWSGCDSISPFTITGTMSCGTGSCVWSSLMALDIVALDLVLISLIGARVISVIFIWVFMDLTLPSADLVLVLPSARPNLT